jgi:hypothetical protein
MRKMTTTDTNRDFICDQIHKMPSGHEVILQKKSNNRTLAQLRTAFLWVSEIRMFFADAGKFYTTEEIRVWLNDLFLAPVVKEIEGRIVEIPVSWADIDKDRFAKFMDKVDRYCVTELGLYLTMPHAPEDK